MKAKYSKSRTFPSLTIPILSRVEPRCSGCRVRWHIHRFPGGPHSDFHTPTTRILKVSANLIRAYRGQSPAETLGSQVLPPLSFTACRRPYSGSLPGAYTLYFPDSLGLLPKNRGSACIAAFAKFIPQSDSPSNDCPTTSYEAAPFA